MGPSVPFPLTSFRDASWLPADYRLSLVDCLNGLVRAVQLGWFDPCAFDLDQVKIVIMISYFLHHLAPFSSFHTP
jgi:hypothetical protein